MVFDQRLEVSQTQHLAMTPQLRQAISLLKMSNVELVEHLLGEAENNPLLELIEPAPQDTESVEQNGAKSDVRVQNSSERISRNTLLPGTENFDPLENIRYEQTLRDRLRDQILISERNASRSKIALALIDELDDRGWLATPLFEIADRLGVSQASVEAALVALQACDPLGIGARNLQECLEIQLLDTNSLTALMQVLTANLDIVAKGDIRKLEKLAGVSFGELDSTIATLRQLNPRPAADFDKEVVQIAIADITVIPDSAGGWLVELNTDALPKVLVNEKYVNEVTKNGAIIPGFISKCHADARFLVKAMDQRAKTILRVATVIVRHQNRFFDEGIDGLRPLTLANIAEELNIHESTVSRVTSGKFLYCKRGTFELRFFFVKGIGRNDGGRDIAAPVVRERIRALVSGEQLNLVLSDEKIAKILQDDGVDVARRTVAKYREAMGIPSSNRRRRAHT